MPGVDTRECGVVVDALVTGCIHVEPGDAAVFAQRARRSACHVLDEHRMVMCAHGHVSFVGTLEEGEDGAGGRCLRDLYEFLDPHHGRQAGFVVAGSYSEGDMAALVMGA